MESRASAVDVPSVHSIERARVDPPVADCVEILDSMVLEPLAELAPDLRHPATGRSLRESLAGVTDQAVKRLSS